MRIVIDLQACQSGSRLGGIGRYSGQLFEALCRHCGTHELRVILSDQFAERLPAVYADLSGSIARSQVQVFQVPGPLAARHPDSVTPLAEPVYEALLHRLRPDVAHISSVVEGLTDDVVTSVGRSLPAERVSATLYDLIPLQAPEQYLVDPVTEEHYRRRLADLRRVGCFLAISEYSRRTGIEQLGLAPEQVTNIAAGVDTRFEPRQPGADRAARLRAHYGLRGNYVLYASSFDLRKNHEGLIAAWARLAPAQRGGRQLVMIGNGWPQKYAQLRATAARVGLDPTDLVFTGHVPDEDLLDLYALADLFVFPSLMEGYGLPVLEAMACGIVTVGSNTTSIPEVIGNPDALFDPRDPDDMARVMLRGLSDPGFRAQLRAAGLERAKAFTWDATAKAALGAFEAHYERTQSLPRLSESECVARTTAAVQAVLKERPKLRRALVPTASALAANAQCLVDTRPARRRIGWVTTWNTRCGIAMYARYLAGTHADDYHILAPRVDEQVFEDTPNVTRCWTFSEPNLEALKTAVVDQGIDTLVIQFQYVFFDFPALQRFLQDMIATGRRIFVTFHATTDQPYKRLEQLRVPLALCERLFVHSTNDEAVLARIGLSENVERFPHGVVDVPPVPVRLAVPAGRRMIATYGFCLPHKGFLELVSALPKLVADGLDLQLLMVNAEYPNPASPELIEQIRERAARLGMADRVTLITDFLDDAESLGYLQHADLILYPYQESGESSSAAVRMGLAAGRPVAVTPLKIFDDVRPNVHTLPGTTVDALAQGVTSLLSRIDEPDEALRTVSARAARWRTAHAYQQLSEDLWRYLSASAEEDEPQVRAFSASRETGEQVVE